jgi:hypothetical protein
MTCMPPNPGLAAESGDDHILAAALKYAAAGLPVFPCRPDKTPLIAGWPTEATAYNAGR